MSVTFKQIMDAAIKVYVANVIAERQERLRRQKNGKQQPPAGGRRK